MSEEIWGLPLYKIHHTQLAVLTPLCIVATATSQEFGKEEANARPRKGFRQGGIVRTPN
jgi:hypothetical protein